MEKKTMREELAEIEEKFTFCPSLMETFLGMERDLRYFNRYEWKDGITKEDLIKERDIYLKVLKNIDLWDLRILFYIHNLRGWFTQNFYQTLKMQFQSQCDLLNILNKTDKHIDPLGKFNNKKLKRKTKK